MKLRNILITGLAGILIGAGCQKNADDDFYYQNLKPISYKLKDLVSDEIYWKDITLTVYIQPEDILWDYHEYKEDIFNHVSDFFKEQKINCKIEYSTKPLTGFNSSNEFGVEILANDNIMSYRYLQIFKEKNLDKGECDSRVIDTKGYALTEKGISLMNGSWEEYKHVDTKEELREWYEEISKSGEKIRTIFQKDYASNIVHEVLHCMSLFHSECFNPPVVLNFDSEDYGTQIPNIMSYRQSKITQKYPLGYQMTPFQRGAIHNFIEEGNNYHTFKDSRKDLERYIARIAAHNLLGKN